MSYLASSFFNKTIVFFIFAIMWLMSTLCMAGGFDACPLCKNDFISSNGWVKCTKTDCENSVSWQSISNMKKTADRNKSHSRKKKVSSAIEGDIRLCPECDKKMKYNNGWVNCTTESCKYSVGWTACLDPSVKRANVEQQKLAKELSAWLAEDEKSILETETFSCLKPAFKEKLRSFHRQDINSPEPTLDTLMLIMMSEKKDLLTRFLAQITDFESQDEYRSAILGVLAKEMQCEKTKIEPLLRATDVFRIGFYTQLSLVFEELEQSNAPSYKELFDDIHQRLESYETNHERGTIERLQAFCKEHSDLGFNESEIIRSEGDFAQVRERADQRKNIMLVGTYENYYQLIYISPADFTMQRVFRSVSSETDERPPTLWFIATPSLETFAVKPDRAGETLKEIWKGMQHAPLLLLTHSPDLPDNKE